MRNEEYGITAIKLIFTIIILVAIIVTAGFITKKIWDNNSVKDVKTDLLYIQAKTKVIYDKNIIDENEELLGENITEYPSNDVVNEIVSQSDKWYKLNKEDLETMELGNLNVEDGYLVNYEEADVIYAKGIEENGIIYYKLSDMTDEEIEEETDNQGVDEEEQMDNLEEEEV